MARKSKRESNPLSRQQQAVRTPRLSVRGQLSMNTIMHGNTSLSGLATDANGRAGIFYPLAGQDTGNLPTSNSVDPIGRASTLYQQYRYLPGTVYNHVPSVGVTQPGNVYIAYVTNPEIIEKLVNVLNAGLLATFVNHVRGLGNCKSIPVWQQTSFPMELIYRRLKFDVNSGVAATNPYTDPNENDRSLQGGYVVAIEGAPYLPQLLDLSFTRKSSCTSCKPLV